MRKPPRLAGILYKFLILYNSVVCFGCLCAAFRVCWTMSGEHWRGFFYNLDGFGLKIYKNCKSGAKHTAIKIQVILGIIWIQVRGVWETLARLLVHSFIFCFLYQYNITSISFVLLSQRFQCLGSIIMQWLSISWSFEDLKLLFLFFLVVWWEDFPFFRVIFVILEWIS